MPYKPSFVIRKLEKIGWKKVRQKGSHVVMYNDNIDWMVVVPLHRKDLTIWTFKSILKQAWITENELLWKKK